MVSDRDAAKIDFREHALTCRLTAVGDSLQLGRVQQLDHGASLCWQWSRHASRRRSPLQAFIWQRGRDCDIVDSNGTIRKGALLPQAFIMPWLVLLHYKTGRRRHSLFILPDMLPADTFRRLRVRLLTQPDPVQPPVAHGRH